jgi:hypothetical protein
LALWRSVKIWMLGKGLERDARKMLTPFGPIKSMDVAVPVRRGNLEVKVRRRHGSETG